jgi:AcrR family transcriptional regulator
VTRKYELKKRAEKQAETRQRIVEAAVDLHTTIGPARTSISAIAERAGVQRHTVYAHFPDEKAIYDACTSHWNALHPFPALSGADLEHDLLAIYGWYAIVADDLELFLRDSSVVQAAAMEMEQVARQLGGLADALANGRPRLVRAAIGHALAFETWRSLVRHQGLSNRQAVKAMAALVDAVRPSRPS